MGKAGSKHVPPDALAKQAPAKRKWREPVFGASEMLDGKMPLAWRFSNCDRGGPFSWDLLNNADIAELMAKLPEFETKTWDELHAAGCHPIEIQSLGKTARDRLVQLEHDDQDKLMAFRISGAKRIWCIHDGNLMRVLWWDPKHKAYVTEVDKADRRKRKNRN